jgi:kinesin family protein 5
VFNRIKESSPQIEFSVKVSMLEIYMERLKDLIDPSKDNLTVHEETDKGVYVADLTEKSIKTESEVYQILKLGNSNRSIA